MKKKTTTKETNKKPTCNSQVHMMATYMANSLWVDGTALPFHDISPLGIHMLPNDVSLESFIRFLYVTFPMPLWNTLENGCDPASFNEHSVRHYMAGSLLILLIHVRCLHTYTKLSLSPALLMLFCILPRTLFLLSAIPSIVLPSISSVSCGCCPSHLSLSTLLLANDVSRL